jgi:hypothetical protein
MDKYAGEGRPAASEAISRPVNAAGTSDLCAFKGHRSSPDASVMVDHPSISNGSADVLEFDLFNITGFRTLTGPALAPVRRAPEHERIALIGERVG